MTSEHILFRLFVQNQELWETRKRLQQDRIEKESEQKKVEEEKRLKNISEREQSINRKRDQQNGRWWHNPDMVVILPVRVYYLP